jgi:hypothetical protein
VICRSSDGLCGDECWRRQGDAIPIPQNRRDGMLSLYPPEWWLRFVCLPVFLHEDCLMFRSAKIHPGPKNLVTENLVAKSSDGNVIGAYG